MNSVFSSQTKHDIILFSEPALPTLQENSMFEWLKCLPIHTFEPRHFESDEAPTSALGISAKRVAFEAKNGDVKRSKVDDDEVGGDDDE